MSDYDQQIEEWKARHGLGYARNVNQDELLMAAEESQSKKKAWCFECDKQMPIREMKLITRTVDPYCQIDENPGDYIAKSNRVRMCPHCFEEKYEPKEPNAN